MRRQGRCARIYRLVPVLPRRLLFRQGETFRRRALVRHTARIGGSRPLQGARFAGAGHDQDDRGCRLRHQQRRSDRGGDALPRQQMGGTGAESAVLSLRGNLPQIPRHQPRGTRLHLLSGRSRQGRQNDHRRRPLQDLFHQKSGQGLHDAFRTGECQHRRVYPRHPEQLRGPGLPQCDGLHAVADTGTPGLHPQIHQHVPDEERHGVHRPDRRVADAAFHRGGEGPRPAPGAVDPHPGLQAHRRQTGAGSRSRRHDHRLPTHQIRSGHDGLGRTDRPQRPFDLRHAGFPLCRSAAQLCRSQGRTGNAHAERSGYHRQRNPKPGGNAGPRHERSQQKYRLVS